MIFLREIGLTVSSVCALCDAAIENAKQYFLLSTSVTALCEILFSSNAHLLGDRWLSFF